MKKRRVQIAVLLCISLVFGSLSFGCGNSEPDAMKDTVKVLGKNMDGEKAFDYLSYVYLGWRTTGGSWQNQVIDSFIPKELEQAGYVDNGKEAAPLKKKSSNDKSSDHDKDYSWVTYFDVNDPTWDPEYAKLEVVSAPDVSGKKELIDRINVEAAGFDPTSDTYIDYYNEEYGEIKNIDDMWDWIIKKDGDERVNVTNGEEAKLNLRVHLGDTSGFTEKKGTAPKDAKGVTGEAVYIGKVSGKGNKMSCKKYPTPAKANAKLKGKVLLSDSSLDDTFALAKQTGAVAVASSWALEDYCLPKDKDGKIVKPFDKSARFDYGEVLEPSIAQTKAGKPIVQWQFSTDQEAALKALLKESEGKGPVKIKNIAIGDTYAMNDAKKGGKGQAVTFAEIKGATKPDERILIVSHVQEPSSNDNATGVGAMLEMAVRLKTMVDEGTIDRPERTITFMWGDEMNLADYWMDSHPEEKENVVVALDMDMVGEDPEKTGGVMRIEKMPDPSAVYNYTLDELPWEDSSYYDDTFKNEEGNFVRLPDSHTLWGAESFKGLFDTGFYLNDLYMGATQTVIDNHDKDFQVDVCPYEGGSDHEIFLGKNVPALLTWHFNDYTYHTSIDTLNMSSAKEMENVNITTAATALMIANAGDENEELAQQILKITADAAMDRFDTEQTNTDNHAVYTKENKKDAAKELAEEEEVLQAWSDWYLQAIESVETSLLKSPSDEYKEQKAQHIKDIKERTDQALAYAKEKITGQ